MNNRVFTMNNQVEKLVTVPPIANDSVWKDFTRVFDLALRLGDHKKEMAKSLLHAGVRLECPDDEEVRVNRIRHCLTIAQQPTLHVTGEVEEDSLGAEAQRVLVTKWLRLIPTNESLLREILKFFGHSKHPDEDSVAYPYGIKKDPYPRFIAEWLWSLYTFGAIRDEYQDALVPAMLNWGMGHLVFPRNTPNGALFTSVYLNQRGLDANRCLVENLSGLPADKFDSKDFRNYSPGEYNARVALAHLRYQNA